MHRELFALKGRREIGVTLEDEAFVLQVLGFPEDITQLCNQVQALLPLFPTFECASGIRPTQFCNILTVLICVVVVVGDGAHASGGG